MSQLSIHDETTAPEGPRQQLSQVKASWSSIPKLHAILAESPVSPEAEDLRWHDPLGRTRHPQEEPA
ncbi:MAG: hypothetical protein AAF552_06505 [Pseudomonadota bacterium]